MRQRDPAAKALIFTQFSGTLAWLADRLTQEGYGYRTISGSMVLKKRAQVLYRCCIAAVVAMTFLRKVSLHIGADMGVRLSSFPLKPV